MIVQKKESGGRRFPEVNPGVGGDAEHPRCFQMPNCPSVWVLSHWQQRWILAFGMKDFIRRLAVHRIDKRTRKSGSI